MKRFFIFLLSAAMFLSFFTTSYADYENDHINTGNIREDIIEIALSQIGYSAENDNSKYDSAVSDKSADRSATFLSWCANEASASQEVLLRTADVQKLYDFYKKNASVYNPDEHFPDEGDIIFIKKGSKIEKCGLVIKTDDKYITAVIGDENNAVRKKMYSLTSDKIYAYAAPDYSLKAEYTPGKYMITASALNFRNKPSLNSEIYFTIPLATIVNITSINGEWGKIKYKDKEGWINLKYVVAYDDSYSISSEYSVKWNVIDISKWQGDINWDKITDADIDAVIIRIGLRGTSTKEIHIDDRFLEYYKAAKNAGLHVGCYFYSAATTEKEGKEEAEFIINLIKKYKLEFDMPVYLDMEDKVIEKKGKTRIFNATKAFLDRMEEENIYSGVYCSTSWAQDYYNPALFIKHALWIADWRNQCGYKGDYGMWQYTEYGSVEGIDANYTDLNICYINYPALISDLGYNKPKTEKPTNENTTSDIVAVPEEDSSYADESLLKGDVNFDGRITASDARAVLRASAKLETLDSDSLNVADMDNNGKITASDARKILRISARLDK